jgi:hypothetical protein
MNYSLSEKLTKLKMDSSESNHTIDHWNSAQQLCNVGLRYRNGYTVQSTVYPSPVTWEGVHPLAAPNWG